MILMIFLFISIALVTLLIGVIIGQLSVFRKLRKVGILKIAGWEYSAIKIFRLG